VRSFRGGGECWCRVGCKPAKYTIARRIWPECRYQATQASDGKPGVIEPTTELVLSHKHPDDLARVKGLLQQSVAPFSSRHRIRTTTGDIRKVVVVGEPVTDADGRIVATRGFYIDITESFNADLQQSISDELHVIVSHREVIDQAKGMLMVIYQLSADAAVAVLVWRSQELNAKLFTVAKKLVAELPDLLNAHPAKRVPIDHYLLTLGLAR
jgi:hypothetical protein